MQPVYWYLGVAGFLIAVFLASHRPLTESVGLFFSLLAAISFLLSLRARRGTVFISIGVFLFAASLGVFRVDVASVTGDQSLSALVGRKVSIEGYVTREPDLRESSTRLQIRATSLITAEGRKDIAAGVLVVLPAHTPLFYGDALRAEGVLRVPRAFDTGEGRQFRYPEYLAISGVAYELAFAHAESLGKNHGNPIVGAMLYLKGRYLEGLGRVLPEPAAGLGGGITVGDKRGLGPELTKTFQSVGLMHVIVLSGYNITIVMDWLQRGLLRLPSVFRFGSSALVAVSFILISGGAASATRAAIMALLAVYARLTGRMYVALRSLAVVASVMVLWNPLILAFDPGFQLSVLATAGLILFTPFFFERLTFIPENAGLREIAASSLGTQITVLPLLLFQNGSVPLYALPANLLALIVVPSAMLLSAGAALCGALLGTHAALVALPAYALLSYMIKVAELFAALPLAQISFPPFGGVILASLYGTIAYAAYVSNQRAITKNAA